MTKTEQQIQNLKTSLTAWKESHAEKEADISIFVQMIKELKPFFSLISELDTSKDIGIMDIMPKLPKIIETAKQLDINSEKLSVYLPLLTKYNILEIKALL